MHVCMMHISMILDPDACVYNEHMYNVCIYDHQYFTLMHVCVMHVKKRDGRTDGKLNSRSRINCLSKQIYIHFSASLEKQGGYEGDSSTCNISFTSINIANKTNIININKITTICITSINISTNKITIINITNKNNIIKTSITVTVTSSSIVANFSFKVIVIINLPPKVNTKRKTKDKLPHDSEMSSILY